MLLLPILALGLAPTTLRIDLRAPGKAVSPNLYGLMTEEINYSYDGGLYGELVRNRSFKDDPRGTPHWTPVGPDSKAELDRQNPVNEALNVSLRVTGTVANDGYWGFPIRPDTPYRLSFWARSDGVAPIRVRLANATTVFAEAQVDGVNGQWRKFETTLRTAADAPTTKDARLVIETGAGRQTWLSLVSLFPPTYRNRPNGLRPDIMKMLVDMRPAFLRFPGGNYLEGNTFRDRFPWKLTLGPLEDRSGHQGTWGYRSSDGLGMLEFLQWAEDMGAKPLLGVHAGYVLNGDVIKAGTELEGFVKDALDQIEYVIGDPKRTKWGARRAKDGRVAPFPLEVVEIGNEDWFDRTNSYGGRYTQFARAIRKRYPKLKIVSSVGLDDLKRYGVAAKDMPDYVDDHYYNTSWEMMRLANRYDAAPRTGPKVFVGEWASQDVPAPWTDVEKKGPTPALGAALGDAAFMTGLERNADVVEMACYAPLLVNVNPGGRQWAVNLIGYDALSSFGSPSYYAQKMFRDYLGDRTVPFTLTDVPVQTRGDQSLPGVFCSVTRGSRDGTVFVKLVNAMSQPQPVALELPGANLDSVATGAIMTGDPADMNSLAEPRRVAPQAIRFDAVGPKFSHTLPPHSIVVLRLRTK